MLSMFPFLGTSHQWFYLLPCLLLIRQECFYWVMSTGWAKVLASEIIHTARFWPVRSFILQSDSGPDVFCSWGFWVWAAHMEGTDRKWPWLLRVSKDDGWVTAGAAMIARIKTSHCLHTLRGWRACHSAFRATGSKLIYKVFLPCNLRTYIIWDAVV